MRCLPTTTRGRAACSAQHSGQGTQRASCPQEMSDMQGIGGRGRPSLPEAQLGPGPRWLRRAPDCDVPLMFSSEVSRKPLDGSQVTWDFILSLFASRSNFLRTVRKGMRGDPHFQRPALTLEDSRQVSSGPRAFPAPSSHQLILWLLPPSPTPLLMGCLKRMDPKVHIRGSASGNASHPVLSLHQCRLFPKSHDDSISD